MAPVRTPIPPTTASDPGVKRRTPGAQAQGGVDAALELRGGVGAKAKASFERQRRRALLKKRIYSELRGAQGNQLSCSSSTRSSWSRRTCASCRCSSARTSSMRRYKARSPFGRCRMWVSTDSGFTTQPARCRQSAASTDAFHHRVGTQSPTVRPPINKPAVGAKNLTSHPQAGRARASLRCSTGAALIS
jgi:hypothetical protein